MLMTFCAEKLKMEWQSVESFSLRLNFDEKPMKNHSGVIFLTSWL